MAVIELTIEDPTSNEVFTGTPMVDFQGSSVLPEELTGTPIYYRWYSSLYAAAEEQYSMNIIATTAAETVYQHELAMGTHVITFAASDVIGESAAEFEAIQHSGVTGGSEEGDDQRLVHVFKANLLAPLDGASVPHNAVTLQAEAPSQWGIAADIETGAGPYGVNEDYHEINRLQFRWLFEPQGAPTTRPTQEFIPAVEELSYQPLDDSVLPNLPARIEYTSLLPATAVGQYRITLFVEDNLGELSANDSQQITVTLT